MKIGSIKIGRGEKMFIIAEAGVNHNGSLETAKKLVDAAKYSGADAIKFQVFNSERLAATSAVSTDYQMKNTGIRNQRELLKNLELSASDFTEIKQYCDKQEIAFLATPFDLPSAEFIERLDVKAFKISSGDITIYRHVYAGGN